jgi:hypothetical protein
MLTYAIWMVLGVLALALGVRWSYRIPFNRAIVVSMLATVAQVVGMAAVRAILFSIVLA